MKKLKNLVPALFLAKTGSDRRESEKKILVVNSVRTQHEEENSKTKAKKIKKLKNLFPALFLAEMGGDRPNKKEKKF